MSKSKPFKRIWNDLMYRLFVGGTKLLNESEEASCCEHKDYSRLCKFYEDMEEYNGKFSKCVIDTCPTIDLGYERNKCLGNAYKAAKESKALMVEGLMRISGANFVVHAWNKLGDSYFDPTKDYVFESSEFKEEMISKGINELNFDYVKCFEYPVNECNKDEDGNIIFRYSYEDILKIANGKKL